MTCRGICIRHRALKPQGTGRYADGQKRCQVCQVFLKWENFWCPCCGYRLRTRPRNVKYKSKLIAIRKTSESFLIQGNQSSPVHSPNNNDFKKSVIKFTKRERKTCIFHREPHICMEKYNLASIIRSQSPVVYTKGISS